MFQRCVCEKLDDRAFELSDVRSDVLSDEPDHVLGHRRLEVVELGFLSENGDAMLQVRQLDIGDHAPLEATDETRLEAWYLFGRTIAGEDDLPARLIESVEGVKEFLLGGLLPLEELDVVHEQEIGFAKATTELMRRSILNGSDQLVGELLRPDERDARVGLAGE